MSGHLSQRGFNPTGVTRGDPATYLDLTEPGQRSCLALHRAGFAWPPRHRGAGALLPHHFTLTGLRLCSGLRRRRFLFCGTFPRVSPGRRYRPPRPAMSGLSSKACTSATAQPARSRIAPVKRRATAADRPARARRIAECGRTKSRVRARPIAGPSAPDRGCERARLPARETPGRGGQAMLRISPTTLPRMRTSRLLIGAISSFSGCSRM